MNLAESRARFEVEEYDLAATLESGQAFRWEWKGDCVGSWEAATRDDSPIGSMNPTARRAGRLPLPTGGSWVGVVAGRWVELRQTGSVLEATTVVNPGDWGWLKDYLQVEAALGPILASFPQDEPMREAVRDCRGLRLLRQEPWECLASFLLSSTKQIPQIRQGIRLLSERFGEAIPAGGGAGTAWAFPTAARLAAATEASLRECRIGFRAKYLKAVAGTVAGGDVRLETIHGLPLAEARAVLTRLPGVGPKIADCVLLFAYGFDEAFPVDVWILRALRELYFRGRRVSVAGLRDFSRSYFGRQGGYAQQYLFHHARLRAGRVGSVSGSRARLRVPETGSPSGGTPAVTER